MVENFDKMLAGLLRLEETWYIIDAEFHEEEAAIDKFYVKQVLLKVLDAVRKDERNESSRKKEMFQHRRLFIVLEGCMMDKGDKAFEVT